MVSSILILLTFTIFATSYGAPIKVSFLSQFSKEDDIDALVPLEFQDDTELVESVNDVDEILTELLGTGIYDMDNYPNGMVEIDDIESALDGEEYIIVNEESLDAESIAEIQEDSKVLHEDKLEALSITEKIVTVAIEALEEFLLSEEADDGDLDSLETELDLWDDLEEAMEETDTVVVLDVEYTYAEIVEIIEDLEMQIIEITE